MTTAKQMAANRINALASTGPKTAGGKATISQNARKHGVTSQPDPERIRLWVKIILDQPEMSLPGAVGADEGLRLAWLLAQAEVRHNDVAAALKAENISLEPLSHDAEYRAFSVDFTDRAIRYLLGQASIDEVREFQKKRTVSELREKIKLNRETKRRQRLLRRYYREATSARRKAFRAWVKWLERSQTLRTKVAVGGTESGKQHFPETKPLSP